LEHLVVDQFEGSLELSALDEKAEEPRDETPERDSTAAENHKDAYQDAESFKHLSARLPAMAKKPKRPKREDAPQSAFRRSDPVSLKPAPERSAENEDDNEDSGQNEQVEASLEELHAFRTGTACDPPAHRSYHWVSESCDPGALSSACCRSSLWRMPQESSWTTAEHRAVKPVSGALPTS
jgi:hypothetical protein